ncbi:MAG: hypothetical protein WCQ21_33995 [Verrucomicrobiota bacterium]|jgi:hypothetical protein
MVPLFIANGDNIHVGPAGKKYLGQETPRNRPDCFTGAAMLDPEASSKS